LGGSGRGSLPTTFDPLTGRACGINVLGSANFGGLFSPGSLDANQTGGGDPPFFAPMFSVMGLTPEDGIVQSVRIEETSGFDLPVCHIRLANVDKSLSSTILSREQSTFTAKLGWTNPGMHDHGTFVVQRPKFRYETDGELSVDIVAYGEQIRLATTERRKVFRKVSDSDIARQIGQSHGFEVDILKTTPVHDQIIQANESDYKFLARRAKLHGYLLMVEDGVMRFRPPRPCESGIILTNTTTVDGDNNFLHFNVQSRTFMRGLKLHISQIDPITKEEFQVTSEETPTDTQRALGPTNWKQMVSTDEVQPERFLTGEGHLQRREQLRNQVSRMAEASRFVVSGVGSSIGLETLRPQQLIRFEDLGRSSGRYLVTRVTHTISAESGDDYGYMTTFEVVRAGSGEANDPLTQDQLQEAQLESAGAVVGASAALVALGLPT
jgi:phage protein D